MYVYLRSESMLWTVGFYKPSGDWESESDHNSPDDAARRVHYLNGGSEPWQAHQYGLNEHGINELQEAAEADRPS